MRHAHGAAGADTDAWVDWSFGVLERSHAPPAVIGVFLITFNFVCGFIAGDSWFFWDGRMVYLGLVIAILGVLVAANCVMICEAWRNRS